MTMNTFSRRSILRRGLDSNGNDMTIYPAVLCMLLLCIVCKLIAQLRAKCFPTVASSESLLLNNFLERGPGFTRGTIEKLLEHADRWKCDICHFDNLMEALHCHLCGASPNKTQSKLPSEKLESGEPLLQPLRPCTSRQLCARTRKYWTRSLVHDEVMWSYCNELFMSFETQGFILKARRDEGRGASAARPPWNLVWCPVKDAGSGLYGAPLSLHVWTELLHISTLAFSSKYAWFLDQVDSIVLPYETHRMRLKTQRPNVATEALNHLDKLEGDLRCATTRYEFQGEAAIDAGAVQREWYMLVAQSIADESFGLFVITNHATNSYYLNPAAGARSGEYQAVGRFLAQAILSGQVLPLQFSPVLFKAILGSPLSLLDIQWLDAQMYSSLMHVLESKDVEDLALTFSVLERQEDSFIEVDLIPDGANVTVTRATAQNYVGRMARYLLFDRVQTQLEALLEGVFDILPPALLVPFDFNELELLVCGLPTVDVDDWKLNTMASSSLRNSQVYDWFWQVVEALGPEERSKLLQFCTGSSRVPVQGFKGLTSYDGNICHFSIHGKDYTPGMYPVAHACFNRLDLPLYPDKRTLQAAIDVLLQSDPTGFTLV
ncbi:unnamed protein product [Aphanomyces euteiches]